MRSALLLTVPLLLVACGRDANQAALRVDVTPTFKAGCLTVQATDMADANNTVRSEFPMADKTPNVAYSFAVFRKNDWSRNVEIIVEAREASCSGALVFTETRVAQVPEKDVLALIFSATAKDDDDDGYVDASLGERAGTDCDDDDIVRNPGLTEVCDSKDNDCNAEVDDALPLLTYWRDADSDGVGDQNARVSACTAPEGYVDISDSPDCDDTNPERTPGKAEICDFVDNNCAGGVDEGFDKTWYPDADGDGHGELGATAAPPSCTEPAGPAPNYAQGPADDCDEAAADVYPGHPEVCDDKDNDCGGMVDEGIDKNWYPDLDSDGFASSSVTVSCDSPGPKYFHSPPIQITDCDDADADVYPRSNDVEPRCDGVDDDCDGDADDDFVNKGTVCLVGACAGTYVCNAQQDGTVCDAPTQTDYYPDLDGDGRGESGVDPVAVCGTTPPAGHVTNDSDCDDQDADKYLGKAELCDLIDNDCNGLVDDADGGCGQLLARTGNEDVNNVNGQDHDWQAIAQAFDGVPVWLAGLNDDVAYESATTPFVSHDGTCVGNWLGAAFHDANNDLVVVGESGKVAKLSSTPPHPCYRQDVTGDNNRLTGVTLVYEGSSKLWAYVSASDGRLYKWEISPATSGAPSQIVDHGARLWAVHGLDYGLAFAVGDSDTNSNGDPQPRAYALAGGSDSGTTYTFSSTGLPDHSLRDVVVVHSALAYAVGTKGSVYRWTSGTQWNQIDPPADLGAADFTAVTAVDDANVYVVDSAGVIRRYTGHKWVTLGTFGPLKDVSARRLPDGDIALWAVGENGVVVHSLE